MANACKLILRILLAVPVVSLLVILAFSLYVVVFVTANLLIFAASVVCFVFQGEWPFEWVFSLEDL